MKTIIAIVALSILVACASTVDVYVNITGVSGKVAEARAYAITKNPFGEPSARASLAGNADGVFAGEATYGLSKAVLGGTVNTALVTAGALAAAYLANVFSGGSLPATALGGAAGGLGTYLMTKPKADDTTGTLSTK